MTTYSNHYYITARNSGGGICYFRNHDVGMIENAQSLAYVFINYEDARNRAISLAAHWKGLGDWKVVKIGRLGR